jgi:type IV pilus assembly protein PilA
MKKLLKNAKGLTLVELLAVIVILGVIAAIAVPSIGGIIQNAREDADAQSEALILNAAVMWAMANEPTGTTVSVFELFDEGYLTTSAIEVQAGGENENFYTTVTIAENDGVYTATAVARGAAAPTT